jgi:hypothetical protein
MIYEH